MSGGDGGVGAAGGGAEVVGPDSPYAPHLAEYAKAIEEKVQRCVQPWLAAVKGTWEKDLSNPNYLKLIGLGIVPPAAIVLGILGLMAPTLLFASAMVVPHIVDHVKGSEDKLQFPEKATLEEKVTIVVTKSLAWWKHALDSKESSDTMQKVKTAVFMGAGLYLAYQVVIFAKIAAILATGLIIPLIAYHQFGVGRPEAPEEERLQGDGTGATGEAVTAAA